MSYKLVFIDEDGHQIGPDVLQLTSDPHGLLVVMPPSVDWVFPARVVAELTEALEQRDIRALVLTCRVSFARLERVDE